MVVEAEEFFAKMDADMDKGWQMSRQWVESPDRFQRCQIAADKLMTAYDEGNDILVKLMAAYILNRLPGIVGVRVNTEGEMTETELVMGSAEGAGQ
jgi:hypothetical protein